MLTYVVLLEELLRVVVAVDVDLGERVEDGWVLVTGLYAGLQPRQNQLEAIASLDLMYKLVDGEIARNRRQKGLDASLITVYVEQSTDNLGRPCGIDTLHVYLDEVDEAILVQVEYEIVHEAEPVANNDERELVGELGFLEEVLDLLRVVEVALATNALDLANLASTGSSLDVLEVYLGVLAEVDDGPKVVVQTWRNIETCEESTREWNAPSKVLKDSNISISLTGPRISEYLVAIWMTACRFWRILTRSIS